VHCKGGVSRSPTVVVAFLMKEKGWSFKRAAEEVQERRRLMMPNPTFCQELK